MNQKLPAHEWAAVLVIFTIFLTLLLVSFRASDTLLPQESDDVHMIQDPFVVVTMEGEVANPGEYRVRKGTLLKVVMEQAQPAAEANLSRFKMESGINKSRKIIIKKRKIKKSSTVTDNKY